MAARGSWPGKRELARELDISASYLNEIEKAKGGAPHAELVRVRRS
jgi:hypothetical protein